MAAETIWSAEKCFTLAFSDEFLQDCGWRVGDSWRIPVNSIGIDSETGLIFLHVRMEAADAWRAEREQRERESDAMTPAERTARLAEISRKLGFPIREESEGT